MAASDTRQLQLQISASAELLIRNLKSADNAVADFQRSTNTRLTSIDAKFSALGALKSKLGAIDGNIGIGSAVGAATGVTLIALAKRGLDYASSLQEVSQQLGVTSRDLQVYRYAASQAGISQDEMDKGLAKLTQTLGKARLGADGPTKAFGALGISIDSLNGKSAGEVIPRIAESLSKIKDPAQRAALEVELFGKAGQKLDTLLAGGSAGINELAIAAEKLGLVLSDEQIANADATADKLSAVKQVLEANVAKVVADNATSILSLATSLGTLTGEIIRFLNANPQAALGVIGALVGGRVGGLPGAAAGAFAGYVGGDQIKRRQEDASTDVALRRRALATALRSAAARTRVAAGEAPKDEIGSFGGLVSVRTGSSGRAGGTVQTALAEVNRQRQLLAKALAGPKQAAVPVVATGGGIAVPRILAPSSGGRASGPAVKSAEQIAREAATAARKDRSDQRRANDALSRAELDAAASRADQSGNPDERLKIEQQRVDLARKGRDDDLDLAALDNRYIAANLIRLKSINGQTAEIDKQLLAQRRAQEIDQAVADRARASEDDQIALLEIQGRLAIVAKDRRDIEQRLLALKQQEEREALERVANDKNNRYAPADRALAKEQLDRLPARQAAEKAALAKDQAGPIELYRDRLVAATSDMNEALEGVQANGLQNLEDGLLGIVNGTESVGSAFKKLASSIIADLARIAIEKAIVAAIDTAASSFGSVFHKDGGPIVKRAGGGPIFGPGGPRDDRVPAMLSNGEFVINAKATRENYPLIEAINAGRLPRFARGGPVASRLPNLRGANDNSAGGQRPISFDLRGAVVTEDLLRQMQSIAVETSGTMLRQAAPAIVDAATSNTMNTLRRPGI